MNDLEFYILYLILIVFRKTADLFKVPPVMIILMIPWCNTIKKVPLTGIVMLQ